MIYSMTAFSRIQNQGEWGTLVCEIRSINHRYLEIGLHLPDVLRGLEMAVRDTIRKSVKRGKIDCAIRFQPAVGNDNSVSVNTSLAKALIKAGEEIAGLINKPAPLAPNDILRFPGVLESKEIDAAIIEKHLFTLLQTALADLVAARSREGEELKQLFLQRMDLLQNELAKVKKRLPQVLLEQRERLLKRLADAKVELDLGRLEQEMVMFAQRIDVAEEIDRTETHILEVKRILAEGGLIGRRLDFLLQELNREANTLGSKSVDSGITHAAVEMKVLIEQVREQVQNIE